MRGVVSAGDKHSAQAGAWILENGGNAYDAAVAVMLASPMCEPLFTSLGGGGFLLGLSKNKKPTIYDFFVQVPPNRIKNPDFYPVEVDFGSAKQEFHVGAGSVAIPGMVKGIYEIYKDYCKLPLSELIQPALKYAKEGLYLSSMQADFLKLLKPMFLSTPPSRALYEKDGDLIDEKHLFKNSDYVNFLEEFAREGSRFFYEGEVASNIEKMSKEHGGLIYKEDLKSYECIKREPIEFDFKGHQIFTNSPPSGGGILIAFTLKLLENYNFKNFRSFEHVKGLVEAFCITGEFRKDAVDKFLHVKGLEDILSDESLIQKYASMLKTKLNYWGNTTHVSIIDEEENALSFTTTNGEGSGYMVEDCGILLNNMLGEEDLNPHGWFKHKEGLRLPSMMAPTAVLKDGKPKLLLGSAGSNRIRSAIIQTILNNLIYGYNLQKAINSPRIHFEKSVACMEFSCKDEIMNELKKHYELKCFDELNLFFGGVQAVDGDLNGGYDERRGAACIKV